MSVLSELGAAPTPSVARYASSPARSASISWRIRTIVCQTMKATMMKCWLTATSCVIRSVLASSRLAVVDAIKTRGTRPPPPPAPAALPANVDVTLSGTSPIVPVIDPPSVPVTLEPAPGTLEALFPANPSARGDVSCRETTIHSNTYQHRRSRLLEWSLRLSRRRGGPSSRCRFSPSIG